MLDMYYYASGCGFGRGNYNIVYTQLSAHTQSYAYFEYRSMAA